MKFSCDSCGAQYQISDAKLGARGVKVRCKRCQKMLVVRPKGFVEAAAQPSGYGGRKRPAPRSPSLPGREASQSPSTSSDPGIDSGGSGVSRVSSVPRQQIAGASVGTLDVLPGVPMSPRMGGTPAGLGTADIPLPPIGVGSQIPIDELGTADLGGGMSTRSVDLEPAQNELGEGWSKDSALGSPQTNDSSSVSQTEVKGVEGQNGHASEPAVLEHIERAHSELPIEPGSPAEDVASFSSAGPSEDDPSEVEKEIGSAFEAMFEGEVAPEPESPSVPPPPRPETISPRSDWFVAIKDEQVGPLSVEEVQLKWSEGLLDAKSLCWRQGMKDWAAISEVTELAGLAQAPEAPVAGSEISIEEEPPPPTLAAAVVPSPRIESTHGEEAPEIQLKDSVEKVRSRDTADDGWRPSAASALASLAEEEFQPESDPVLRPLAGGKMTAIPTVSSELSDLITGGGRQTDRTASMFGLAEKSASKVRAIPRRADAMSSGPLADPEPPASPRSPVAVAVAALLVLGGIISITVAAGLRRAQTSVVEVREAQSPKEGSSSEDSLPTSIKNASQLAATKISLSDDDSSGSQERTQAQDDGAQKGAVSEGVTEAVTKVSQPHLANLGTASESEASVARAEREASTPTAKATTNESSRSKAQTTRRRRRRPRRVRPRPERRNLTQDLTTTRSRSVPRPRTPPVVRSSAEDLLVAAAGPTRSTPPPEPQLPSKPDETEVFRVLRQHKAQVRDCLEKHSRSGGTKGRVRVTITILPSGRVSSTSFTPSNFTREILGRCLASNARTWNFPRFSGSPTPVDFPVTAR